MTSGLLIGLPAAAALAVAELFRLESAYRLTTGIWRRWHSARATTYLSSVVLERAHKRGLESLDDVVPAVAMCVDTVAVLLSLSEPDRHSTLRVATPPRRQSASMRAAIALLAAHSLQSTEVPELQRAISTRSPQMGANLADLLRYGVSSLPMPTRERLLAALMPTPYVAVPVLRSSGVVALLIATGGDDDQALQHRLVRIASRVALVFPVPSCRLAERRPALPTEKAGEVSRRVEMVLWLDPSGSVAASEAVEGSSWSIDPAPATLDELFPSGSSTTAALLSTARSRGRLAPMPATLRDGTEVELSLVPLSDVDDNLWGYATLVRRAMAPVNVRRSRFAR